MKIATLFLKLSKPSKYCASVLLFFLLLSFRLPFLTQPPLGEENHLLGITKAAMTGYPFVPGSFIPAYLDGKPFYNLAGHPTGIYLFLHLMGVILRGWTSQISLASRSTRLVIAALFCLVSTFALWQEIKSRPKSNANYLICAFAIFLLSFPFLIGCSLQIQQDGTWGAMPYVLITTFYAFYENSGNLGKRLSKIGLFLSAALAGIDKPERLAIWISARAISEVVLTRDKRARTPILRWEAFGLIAGIGFELLFDYENWLASFRLMSAIGHSKKPSLGQYVRSLTVFFPFPVLLTWLMGLGLFVKPFLKGGATKIPRTALATALSTVLFVIFGFAAGLHLRWVGDGFPRYFSVFSLFLCLLSVQWFAFYTERNRNGLLVVALLTCWLAWTDGKDLLHLKKRSVTTFFGEEISIRCDPLVPIDPKCLKAVPPECALTEKSPNWAMQSEIIALSQILKRPVCAKIQSK